MLKTFRKSIAIMLALVFVLSLVPFSAMAEGAEASTETVTLTRIHQVYTDMQSKDAKENTNHLSYIQFGGGNGYRDHATVKFDFSGYEEIMRNDGTKVFFNFVPRSSNYPAKKFEVYIAKDACDTYDLTGITYNQANNLGFYDRTTRPLIYTEADTTIKTTTAYSSDELDVSKFINALDEGVDNSTLSLYFYAYRGSALVTKTNDGSDYTKIAITYDKNAVNNKDYVDGLLAELDWSKISAEGASSVTAASKLPLKYKGANVTWTSSNNDVVDPETGVITQPQSGTVDVTLTASLSYTDHLENTAAAEGSKEIKITVVSAGYKSVVIPLSEHTFISSTDPQTPKGLSGTSYYVRYMYPAGLYNSSTNDRLVFLKWDFSEHLDKLAVATSMSMSMKNIAEKVQAGKDTHLSVLPDGYESWTENDLTYDIAVEKGLYTTPGIYTQTVSPLSAECEIASSAEFLNAIKKSVADNPDDGVVNFRWEATDVTPTAYRLYDNKKDYFTITLYYDEADLAGNYSNSKVSSMPWSYVSQQPQDKVVADLTLPGKFYGETVTWESSDEAVITNSGEVVAGNNGGTAILTATVNGLTKDFEVTVPANTKFVLDSSKQNYVNGYVWAKEAVNNCAVVVATYVDGELISVKVKDDSFNLNKGENFIWTDLDGTGAGKTVKVMLLEDMTTLKPLAIAK